MGAYYTHMGSFGLTLHVNEFNYHPPFNYPTGDWVELHNSTAQAIDLRGWRMAHGLHEFVFRENTVVAPGGYLVVCQNSFWFKNFHPGAGALAADFHFDLNNKSGKIALYDAAGALVHSVRYTDSRPFPPLADGQGATVELSQGKQGNLPTDWRESHVLLGSPGEPNSLPPDVSELYVNEILTSNTHTLPDEQGEYDDWFELYNASVDSLNVGGLCFTDDEDEPCPWQVPLHFPNVTTIPPHGFLLLWADGQTGQGLLHAGFRLSAGGEMVAVFQRENEGYLEVERLPFGQQSSDVSWGRYPDGGSDVAFMHPTPGATNVSSVTEEPEVERLEMYPNPFSQQLFIDVKQVEKPYRLRVVNKLGRVVYESDGLWGERAVLERGALEVGVYAVEVVDAEGRQYVGRVVLE
jgi:hypothetical protein